MKLGQVLAWNVYGTCTETESGQIYMHFTVHTSFISVFLLHLIKITDSYKQQGRQERERERASARKARKGRKQCSSFNSSLSVDLGAVTLSAWPDGYNPLRRTPPGNFPPSSSSFFSRRFSRLTPLAPSLPQLQNFPLSLYSPW